ncbi:MAG: hypothetical protein GXP10_05315 [Gammaproteobacteria bacterium]|nr:hypothetical protein [Gammaproteobacteria bacterium]
MMLKRIIAIARFTVVESFRHNMLLLLLSVTLLGYFAGLFAGTLSITESQQAQQAVTAALFRLGLIFIIVLCVISSVAKEYNDKCIDVMLSVVDNRAEYYFGKLLGFFAIALVFIVAFTLLVSFISDGYQALIWGMSLAMEAVIVIAFSILCVLTFPQIPLSMFLVMAFYFLSRAIGAIVLMLDGPLADTTVLSQKLMVLFIEGISYLLPDLDSFTRTEWLVYQSGELSIIAPLFMQSVLYTLFISACALFDLYRKSV